MGMSSSRASHLTWLVMFLLVSLSTESLALGAQHEHVGAQLPLPAPCTNIEQLAIMLCSPAGERHWLACAVCAAGANSGASHLCRQSSRTCLACNLTARHFNNLGMAHAGHPPAPDVDHVEHGPTCSRQASRDAAAILAKVLQPRIAASKYTLPPGCPLDAKRSVYSGQEEHKVLVRKNVWRCKYDGKARGLAVLMTTMLRCAAVLPLCSPAMHRGYRARGTACMQYTRRCVAGQCSGRRAAARRCFHSSYIAGQGRYIVPERLQTFRGEKVIDAHMAAHHADQLDPSSSDCLADLCGLLHCNFFAAHRAGRSQHHSKHAPCHAPTAQRLRARCQDVAHACFPPHLNRAAESLHAFVQASFCEAATCRWRECAPPTGQRGCLTELCARSLRMSSYRPRALQCPLHFPNRAACIQYEPCAPAGAT
jgi:hypothetical protein